MDWCGQSVLYEVLSCHFFLLGMTVRLGKKKSTLLLLRESKIKWKIVGGDLRFWSKGGQCCCIYQWLPFRFKCSGLVKVTSRERLLSFSLNVKVGIAHLSFW